MHGMNGAIAMRRQVLEERAGGRVVAMDTITVVGPAEAGAVVVCGSHGGISSGEFAGRVAVAAVFFNDAGGGKDEAGRAALPYLEARGIAAGTVSHDSAMIGDALDAFENGVISGLNEPARAQGYALGEPLRAAIRRTLGAPRHAS